MSSAKKNKIPNNIPIPKPKNQTNNYKPTNINNNINNNNEVDSYSNSINIEKDIKNITKHNNDNSNVSKYVENILKSKETSGGTGYADTKKYQKVLTENISQILNNSHKNTNQSKSTISHLKNLNIDTSRINKNKK